MNVSILENKPSKCQLDKGLYSTGVEWKTNEKYFDRILEVGDRNDAMGQLIYPCALFHHSFVLSTSKCLK